MRGMRKNKKLLEWGTIILLLLVIIVSNYAFFTHHYDWYGYSVIAVVAILFGANKLGLFIPKHRNRFF